MEKQAYEEFYTSIGMPKTAQLAKYVPWVLGAGALGGAGLYGYHKYKESQKPKTLWDRVSGVLGEMGHSYSDFKGDVSNTLKNNPVFMQNVISPLAYNLQQALLAKMNASQAAPMSQEALPPAQTAHPTQAPQENIATSPIPESNIGSMDNMAYYSPYASPY